MTPPQPLLLPLLPPPRDRCCCRRLCCAIPFPPSVPCRTTALPQARCRLCYHIPCPCCCAAPSRSPPAPPLLRRLHPAHPCSFSPDDEGEVGGGRGQRQFFPSLAKAAVLLFPVQGEVREFVEGGSSRPR
ncbi:hypothetical protein BRADI_3g20424v3 [Brachypodium distachyon]|uniref:Uncharacterized protein n=1 Tax=Brachypodium distachyon TaxID=15368 RepID=A0A2K2CYI4_BRADI|nr:hypothetical protein BRADI_3g20424v3 [Brachypodium distachyon]